MVDQTQSPGSFVTPAERNRREGILPLPTLAIPFRTVEAMQQVLKQEQKVESPTPKIESPGRKMEFPAYDGQNPDDWIFRMEKCFSVNHTPEEERLEMALACMTGCAVTWLRITQDREDLRDWRDFKDKLKKRFKPTRGGTIIRQLLRLRQAGSVTEYREQFEELSAEVPHVTNDVLEEILINGMRKNLEEQVVRYRPMGMDDIVDMAKMIEEQELDKGN